MMTVAQASAVNRLADYLTGNAVMDVSAEAARDALAVLADGANKKLMAGWSGDQVRAADFDRSR